jgi:hypothetical protein
MRVSAKSLVTVALLLLLAPALASAQIAAQIAGTVKDASGAVLPGVTVEATSPTLAAPRSVVSDGSGQYRIIDLPPGTYAVTATLPGFNTYKRDGIELSGTMTATIPVELKVGALQETITVSGETPVVDVQNTKRELTVNQEVIAAIPATRTVGSLLNLTPGITVDNNGLNPTPTMTFFSARGGPTNEGRMSVNGMTVSAAFNGGGVSSYILDTVGADEVTTNVSGGLGEMEVGGPVMNIVPRAGGNRFAGTGFYSNAGEWSRSNNLDSELTAPPPGPNLHETPGIIKLYDASISYGGPIVKDRLWFYGSYRKLNTITAIEGVRWNKNTYDLSRWDWIEDPSISARNLAGRQMFIDRFSAQVTSKNRITFAHEYQKRCEGSPLKTDTNGCNSREAGWVASSATTTSPEASTNYIEFPYTLTQVLWTNPYTNKILLEGGFSRLAYDHAGGPGQLPPDGIFDITVTEASTSVNPATGLPYAPRANYQYRALAQYSDNKSWPMTWRGSASYVTGAHNMKVGYQGSYLANQTDRVRNPKLLNYGFNAGSPTGFNMAIPEWETADRTEVAAFYGQDSWTHGRLTIQAALRYDHSWSFSPAEHNGTTSTSAINPAPITFAKTYSVHSFNDITPRWGMAYDVFGTGKTAIKWNMGHYLVSATNDGRYTVNNPANLAVSTFTANRGWTDVDGDKVVDCDLLNLNAQSAATTGSVDTCAALTGNNLNFGKGGALTNNSVNPALLKGWGVRPNDWQYGITLQQQVIPRVSLDVGYSHRWFRGVQVVDNVNRDPSQYEQYTVTAPKDPRFANGGGYPITIYTPTAAASAIAAQNFTTFQTDFGPEQKNYYDGVDVSVNARLKQGITAQVGTTTGRSVVDACATGGVNAANQPQVDSPDLRNCRTNNPFQTTLRGLASYTIPKIDVLVSATLRSQPVVTQTATMNLPNTCLGWGSAVQTGCSQETVLGLLGHLPTGSTAAGTTAITINDNDHQIWDTNRRAQLDMRFAKIVRMGKTRTDIGVDLNNMLNANYPTTWDNTYQLVNTTQPGGTWNNPTAILAPRYVRLNFTVNF